MAPYVIYKCRECDTKYYPRPADPLCRCGGELYEIEVAKRSRCSDCNALYVPLDKYYCDSCVVRARRREATGSRNLDSMLHSLFGDLGYEDPSRSRYVFMPGLVRFCIFIKSVRNLHKLDERAISIKAERSEEQDRWLVYVVMSTDSIPGGMG